MATVIPYTRADLRFLDRQRLFDRRTEMKCVTNE